MKSSILYFIAILLVIVGNVAVGYAYILAQSVFIVSNVVCLIADFKTKANTGCIIKDVCFLGLAIGLIIIYVI